MARAQPANIAPLKNRRPNDVVARTPSVTREMLRVIPSESVVCPNREIEARAASVRASVHPL